MRRSLAGAGDVRGADRRYPAEVATRVIARRYTLEVPERPRPGCAVWRGRDAATGAAVVVTILDEHPEADTTLAALAAVRHPSLPVVLDHFAGGVIPGPEGEGHLQQLLKAMANQPLYVKLSAAYRLPSGCAADALARQFHAAAPQQVLWGSDWPHTGGSGGGGRKPHEVEPFRDINNMAALQHIVLALDSAQATQQLLADNPTRLYGF